MDGINRTARKNDNIVLIGFPGTGKTTVGAAIEADLAKDYKVYKAVAGSFYRRLTVLALEAHGAVNTDDNFDWLEPAIKNAIESRAAYDETRNWDTINTKEIDELVSVAGQFPVTQTAGKEWWNIMADLATQQGAEVLVVDGRNPRAKSAAWRANHDLPIALDLCVYCDPDVAAQRYVSSQGVADPTAEQLAAARSEIVKRRELDRNRPAAPYIEPPNQILFDSGTSDPAKVVLESFETAIDDPPRVIRFDTTHSPLEMTQITAGQLARAALDYLNK